MVIATQNPIEQEGTYPLPEAQLDRFLMKIILDYPSQEAELKILAQYGAVLGAHDSIYKNVTVLGEASALDELKSSIPAIKIEEGIVRYAQTIIEQTRRSPHFYLGVSPRGGIALLRASQCLAVLEGMDFITPDHVKQASLPVLRHRVIMRPEAELEGLTPDRVLSTIIDEIPIPR
jgi:MoxR-like ATPase